MRTRKLLAVGMATLLTLSSSVMAFAADATSEGGGTIAGDGSLEGYVDKEVFTATFPTTANVDFKLDPQELLLATGSSDTLDGSALAKGYGSKILFADEAGKYLSKSKDITVINKSTFDVDVEVSAKITGLKKEGTDGYDIKVMDPTVSGFDFGDATAITMSITPTPQSITGTTETPGTAKTATVLTDAANGVSVTEKIEKSTAVDSAYEVKKTGNVYSYSIKADTDLATVAFNEMTFNLAGTVNTAADWTNFSKDASSALKVEVTYNVKKHVDGPQVALTADGKITISNLTADKNFGGYADVVCGNGTDSFALRSTTATFDGANWSTAGGTAIFQMGSSWKTWNDDSVTVTVTLSDGTTITSNAVTLAIS